jgi:hypothetical protein
MKTMVVSLALTLAATCAFAGTPTIDGTFDGTGTWGDTVSTNTTSGWAGVTATNLYTTNDANYVYFACQFTGLATWMSYGFAIDSKAGGCPTGSQEPWLRQINLSFATASGNVDFVVRGNCDNSWHEFRTWNGGTSSWDGSGTNIGTTEVSVGTDYIECRVPKATMNISSFFDVFVECFISGNNNAHGTFTSCPTDQVCTNWNEAPPDVLQQPFQAFVPVTVSAFEID